MVSAVNIWIFQSARHLSEAHPSMAFGSSVGGGSRRQQSLSGGSRRQQSLSGGSRRQAALAARVRRPRTVIILPPQDGKIYHIV